MPTHLNTLPAPVVLVTKGRGREVFRDSAALLGRLAVLAELGDRVMQIESEKRVVTEAGIDALNFMLRRFGLDRFETASRKRENRRRAFITKYDWEHFSAYMGWEWRDL